MATSSCSYIEDLCRFLIDARGGDKKNSELIWNALDIGFGFGKNGFLIREYAELWYGNNVDPKSWKHNIDGIEAFGDYIQDWHNQIYNKIYMGDALDVLPSLDKYDLIVMTDVLEHFEKDDGFKVLDLIFDKCDNFLITTQKNPHAQKEV